MRAKLGIYVLNPLKLAELADNAHTGMHANAATFPKGTDEKPGPWSDPAEEVLR